MLWTKTVELLHLNAQLLPKISEIRENPGHHLLKWKKVTQMECVYELFTQKNLLLRSQKSVINHFWVFINHSKSCCPAFYSLRVEIHSFTFREFVQKPTGDCYVLNVFSASNVNKSWCAIKSGIIDKVVLEEQVRLSQYGTVSKDPNFLCIAENRVHSR